METDTSAPPSPRYDNGWTLVERPAAEGTYEFSEGRPRTEPSSAEPSGEQSTDHDESHDGVKSPESERLADDLLREPFQAGGRPLQRLTVPPSPASTPVVEEPGTPTGASGPYAPSCGGLTCHACQDPALQHQTSMALAAAVAYLANHQSNGSAAAGAGGVGAVCGGCSGCGWGFEPHRERERERLRAASRLSGEGALEGFQDPQDLPLANATAQVAGEGALSTSEDDDALAALVACGGCSGGPGAGPGGAEEEVTLNWEGLVSSLWSDMLRELADMRALVTTTAAALWERVQDGRMAVEEWAAAVRAAAHQAAKSAGRWSCPLWALLGMSGLAAMALTALCAQVAINRRLAAHLRQRDRDLARLVVKILNLQDALQTAARSVPLVRTSSLERFTTTTTLIGMV